jgi:hypothetical protein
MTHAVLALDVRTEPIDISPWMRGAARKFLPHVTVLPRFEPAANAWTEIIARARTLPLAGLHPFELIGPVRICSELAWYEALPDQTGYDALTALHRAALHSVGESNVWFVENFIKANYRPHLTIRWRVPVGDTRELPSSLRARATALSFYQYEIDPELSSVQRVVVSEANYEAP